MVQLAQDHGMDHTIAIVMEDLGTLGKSREKREIGKKRGERKDGRKRGEMM